MSVKSTIYELPQTLTIYDKVVRELDVNRLNEKWNSIEKKYSGYEIQPWKKFADEQNEFAQEVRKFRSELVIFLNRTVCTKSANNVNGKGLCISSGSNSFSSNVDVTVKGSQLKENAYRLAAIHLILETIFKGTRLDLENIFLFFDLNFYLSDFAISNEKLNNKVPTLPTLSSYRLATNLEQQLKHLPKTLNKEQPVSLVKNKNEYFNLVMETAKLIDDRSSDNDMIINSISKFAKLEDECYITQGAFMHVVYMIQRKIDFVATIDETTKDILINFMYASILENLRFAYSHGGASRGKYLYRVLDAHLILTLLKSQKTLDTQPLDIDTLIKDIQYSDLYIYYLGGFWKNINSIDNIKIVYQCYLARYNKKSIDNRQECNDSKLKDMLAKDYDEHYIKRIYEGLYKSLVPTQSGGKYMKKLLDKNKNFVKKTIAGRERVVYVDKKRCQYVKLNGSFITIAELRKTSKKKSKN